MNYLSKENHTSEVAIKIQTDSNLSHIPDHETITGQDDEGVRYRLHMIFKSYIYPALVYIYIYCRNPALSVHKIPPVCHWIVY